MPALDWLLGQDLRNPSEVSVWCGVRSGVGVGVGYSSGAVGLMCWLLGQDKGGGGRYRGREVNAGSTHLVSEAPLRPLTRHPDPPT